MGVRTPDLYPVHLSHIMAWQNPCSEISEKGEVIAGESVICHDMSLYIDPELLLVPRRD
jgi:hypothetical protein